jgi:hypothetical protein
MIGDVAILYVGYLVLSVLALLTMAVRGQLWTEGHLSSSATILLFLYGNMVVVGGISVFVMARGRSMTLLSDRIVYRHWLHAPVEVPLREMARVVRCEVRPDGRPIALPPCSSSAATDVVSWRFTSSAGGSLISIVSGAAPRPRLRVVLAT